MKKNFIFSLFNIAASVVAMLLLLPLIQNSLGVEAYGYIAVSLSFVNISTIVSAALTSMASRFITIALQKGNAKQAQEYFNTVLLACLLLFVMMVVAFGIIAMFIEQLMNVSPEFVAQLRILLVILSLSLGITITKAPFVAGLYYSNSLYVDYLFTGCSHLARVLGFVAFSSVFGATIWLPYASALAIDCLAIAWYVSSYKRHLPDVGIAFGNFKWSSLREILSSGIWVSVSKAGAVLLSTISLYLSNIILGSYLSGVFASMTQLQSFMAVFATAVVSLFVPYYYKSYARGKEDFGLTVRSSCLFGGLVIGACFGPVFTLAAPFLELWTTASMSEYAPSVVVLIGYPVLAYVFEFVNQVFITTKSVKIPALVTIAFGILNIIMTLFFCFVLKMELLGIALAQAISILLRNYLLYTPLMFRALAETMSRNWFKPAMCCPSIALVSGIAAECAAFVFQPVSWTFLIADGVLGLMAGALASYAFLNRVEREQFGLMIHAKFAGGPNGS